MSIGGISGSYGTDWWTAQLSGQAAYARQAAAHTPAAQSSDTAQPSFQVTLSGKAPDGTAAQNADAPRAPDGSAKTAQNGETGDTGEKTDAPARPDERKANGEPLSEQEQKQLDYLKKRDQEVRAHEMAHVAVGGDLVKRGASYEYETGPDGKRYAVGGDVIIDTSAGRTPEDTLRRAERIRAAAMAPAEPSTQDYNVARQADQMAMQARLELRAQQQQAASRADKEGEGGRAMQNSVAGDVPANDDAAYARMVTRVGAAYGTEIGGSGNNIGTGQRIRVHA